MPSASGGLRFGYIRVSTADQNEHLQHDALATAGCERIFVDHATGKAESRPGLDSMLEQLRPGDTVVVWRLDRLGRSVKHLIELAARFGDTGVGLVSLRESIDTTSPAGRLFFHLLAALAEFERDLIRERTNAGLAAARARGRVGGRPTVWTDEKLATARALHAGGQHDTATIARILNVSRASVYRALARPE